MEDIELEEVLGRRTYDKGRADIPKISEREWGRLLEKIDNMAKCQEQLRIDFREFSAKTEAKLDGLTGSVIDHENALDKPKTFLTGVKFGAMILGAGTIVALLLLFNKHSFMLNLLGQ